MVYKGFNYFGAVFMEYRFVRNYYHDNYITNVKNNKIRVKFYFVKCLLNLIVYLNPSKNF